MANLTVFTLTGPSRGSIAHWMLEEVEGPYDRSGRNSSITGGPQQRPAWPKAMASIQKKPA